MGWKGGIVGWVGGLILSEYVDRWWWVVFVFQLSINQYY